MTDVVDEEYPRFCFQEWLSCFCGVLRVIICLHCKVIRFVLFPPHCKLSVFTFMKVFLNSGPCQ